MISKRISLFGILASAAVVSGVLAGCGGSSSSVQGLTPFVPVTGGVSGGTTATSNNSVSASTTPQQVQVTLPDGSTLTGTLPAGQAINAGDVVGVVPPNQPIIGGISYAGPKRAASPGDLFVDGTDSGIQINPDTSFPVFVILPNGQHTLSESGPFNISNGNNTLTVQQFIFKLEVQSILGVGLISLPTSVTGRLPANGGSTANGNGVAVDLVGQFVGHTATLTVQWPGVTKAQTKRLNGISILGVQFAEAKFRDPLSDSSDVIPATGVNTVELDINPPHQ